MTLHLYTVETDYVKELNKLDNKVQMHHGKFEKPYLGIVLKVSKFDYFIPLSSAKEKHEKMKNPTLIKVQNKGELKAVLNVNNMIPVPKSKFKMLNIDKVSSDKYKQLLLLEIREIRKLETKIKKTAKFVHKVVMDQEKNNPIKKMCCDLPALEKYCYEHCFKKKKRKEVNHDLEL